MNKGTLVYIDSMSVGDIADDFMEIHTELDSEDDNDNDDEVNDGSEFSKEKR